MEEQLRLGPAPPTPVPGRPAPPWGAEPRRAEHPADRGSADGEPLSSRELLREVVVVQPGVAPPGQGHDLRAQGLGEAVVRGTPPTLVCEGGRPGRPESVPKATHLAGGEAQRFGGLRRGDPSTLE